MKIENEKIIFLHPGKTGGTSIEFALRDCYLPGYKFNSKVPDYNVMFGYDKLNKIYLQHANVSIYEKFNIEYRNYNVAVSVRRPYERILSCYFYNGKDKLYNFETFVASKLEKISRNKILNHFSPQHTYFKNQFHVIKLENFDQDTMSFGIHVRYHHSKTIGTKKIHNRMSMYNQRTKDIIYNIYKEDFLLFGYKK
jgi:hypothetical protein